jgi:hypothetical protein
VRRLRITLATAALAAVATLAVATAAPGSPAAGLPGCATFTGPTWSYVDPLKDPPNQSGTKWKVIVTRVKCSFATMWAKKLVKTPFKGEALTMFKVVPKGWTCIAGGGLTGGGKGTSGTCSKGTNPTVQSKNSFSWGPAR